MRLLLLRLVIPAVYVVWRGFAFPGRPHASLQKEW